MHCPSSVHIHCSKRCNQFYLHRLSLLTVVKLKQQQRKDTMQSVSTYSLHTFNTETRARHRKVVGGNVYEMCLQFGVQHCVTVNYSSQTVWYIMFCASYESVKQIINLKCIIPWWCQVLDCLTCVTTTYSTLIQSLYSKFKHALEHKSSDLVCSEMFNFKMSIGSSFSWAL